MYNLKDVAVDLGNGSDFDGEWMFMLSDGTVITFWDLVIEDEADEQTAKSFGWTTSDINALRVYE